MTNYMFFIAGNAGRDSNRGVNRALHDFHPVVDARNGLHLSGERLLARIEQAITGGYTPVYVGPLPTGMSSGEPLPLPDEVTFLGDAPKKVFAVVNEFLGGDTPLEALHKRMAS